MKHKKIGSPLYVHRPATDFANIYKIVKANANKNINKYNDERLLPCPFCGSENISYFWYYHHGDINSSRVGIMCNDCPCTVDSGYYHMAVQARNAWNRRLVYEPIEGGVVFGEK